MSRLSFDSEFLEKIEVILGDFQSPPSTFQRNSNCSKSCGTKMVIICLILSVRLCSSWWCNVHVRRDFLSKPRPSLASSGLNFIQIFGWSILQKNISKLGLAWRILVNIQGSCLAAVTARKILRFYVKWQKAPYKQCKQECPTTKRRQLRPAAANRTPESTPLARSLMTCLD